MKMIDAAFAAITVLFGFWISIEGLSYGYLVSESRPGSGFFPFWVGVVIAVLGAINVFRSLAGLEQLSEAFEASGVARTAGLSLVMIVFLVVVPWLGMLLASGILILTSGLIIRPTKEFYFIARLLCLSVILPASAYIVLHLILGVRLIDGFLGF